jgi:hypothetical protein
MYRATGKTQGGGLSVQQIEIFGVASQSCCEHYKTGLSILCASQKPSLYNRRDTMHVTDAGFQL